MGELFKTDVETALTSYQCFFSLIILFLIQIKLVSFQWKRSADHSEEVQASEPCKLALISTSPFSNIPVVICKLDLVFCF